MALYRPCWLLLEARSSFCKAPLTDLGSIAFRKNVPVRFGKIVRGFREKKALNPPVQLPPPSQGPLSPGTLVKPLLFTVGFTSTTIVACSLWEYEFYRKRIMTNAVNSWRNWKIPIWSPQDKKAADWRQQCNDFWNSRTEGEKLFAPVLLANVLVFAAWRMPALQGTMLKFFASNPAARVICWPMLLSTFSHYSAVHLGINMFVLHSFSSPFVASLGKEQATAVYLSAGVIASFSSFIHKVIIRTPGLSVGASGAIMAMLGFFCMDHPEAQLSIVFLPFFTFSAGSAIPVIMGIDLAGIVMGWKLFDHAAHLGGALTGVFWAYYGKSHIWPSIRNSIWKPWNEIRGPVKV